ncbi:MAG: HEAT repeat domain-containing protein, partial [Ignavibacteria bacterium]
GNTLYYYNNNIKIVIGGPGRNTYVGKFDLIIDIGGDDSYYIDRDTTFTDNFNCIIDLAGNDYYTTNSKFALGASMYSSGFIFDKEGDDTYKATSVNLGAAICGIGLIYDESGNDIYSGNSYTIGAGSFGVGAIVDRTGNDVYIANTYGQGFGMTEGIGIIVDNKGNDTYTVSPNVPDIVRTNDHFLSMCQGFGFGLRPYYAGGIGIICDGEGNDNYTADIFGQGGSYWYSLGIIVDSSGNDRYNCFHYAQGSGIHFSVGLFKDYSGWDYYSTNWVSQGCGHDYGFGLCWDVSGNDNYSCYGLSQGAGNANGIGILIDESGRDGYLCKDNNCQGFGTPSREYGGIGLLLDASGNDFYTSNTPLWNSQGYDSILYNSSKWGVLNDYFLPDIHPEVTPDEFILEIDTTKQYSRDDLYLFARTLEPRFNKWASYGFNKMVEDSVNTVQYLFNLLGSDDIRDIVVIRNFVPRIGLTFSNFLIDKLNGYMNKSVTMNTDEVAFAIYIIGESNNPQGGDILLKLTYDSQVRIRTAAVNALGKMNFGEQESDFKNKVAGRLIELAGENNPRKTYNKDIAFAFKNFRNSKDIPVLVEMMHNNFYGARFNAAEDLTYYGDSYYDYLTDDVISRISTDRLWFQAFLNSLTGISESKFENLFSKILGLSMSNDEVVNYNLIDLLKTKKAVSKDNEFIKWAEKTGMELTVKG